MQKIYCLKQIETPRLIIRPVQLGDEAALNTAINNSLEILQQWQPWAKDPSIDATRGFIQRGVFAWQSQSICDFPMVVIHKADQKIIGASGYNDRSDLAHRLYEIGYWCDVDYQGQGLISECANALTRYAFEALKADNVIIMMQCENKKSIAVAERLGFTNEGIKDRTPVDCVSDNPAKNYIYSSNNINNLPYLTASWAHDIEESSTAEIISWAKETLKITDEKAFASSRTIVVTPWSCVLEIHTGKTRVYLKHTPDLLALEADIITLLDNQLNIRVPKIIAHNTTLNCFLMQDAGKTLRVFLKKKFDVELFCKVINNFTSMQLAVADDVRTFIDTGVPDWRLERLPHLYRNLLSKKEILIADGLSAQQIHILETLIPAITIQCQQLAAYGIKPSIVQPDFHDNNILIQQQSQAITLIDLGEIVISQPLFSLVGLLQQAQKHYNLNESDSAYQKLQEAYLQPFQIVAANKNNIIAALKHTRLLHPLYAVLSYIRLLEACDKNQLHAFYDRRRINAPLQSLIHNMQTHDYS